MSLLTHKYKEFKIFCLLSFISTSILVLPLSPQIKMFKTFLSYLFSPTQDYTNQLFAKSTGFWHNIGQIINADQENRSLTKKLSQLVSENDKYTEIVEENKRLKKILNYRNQLYYPSIAARVISADPRNLFSSILIDKGRIDNVEENMVVVTYQGDKHGVVGRVLEVMPKVSSVLLITDFNSEVAAFIQSSRFDGILKGQNSKLCELKYISQDALIKNGDSIMTSGKGGIFPKGLLIGEVAEITQEKNKLFKKAYVLPSINYSRIEDVLILGPRSQ